MRRLVVLAAVMTWGASPRSALALEAVDASPERAREPLDDEPVTEAESDDGSSEEQGEVVGRTDDESTGAEPAARDDPRDDTLVLDAVASAAAYVEQGRYNQALAVLDEAERQRPRPVFVFVRATIEEQRGDCERAADLYERYLELDISEADAEEARRGLRRCRPDVAEPSDAGEVSVSEDAGADRADRADRPWVADPLGASLASVGIVGVGVGVGLLVSARADARAARGAPELQVYDDAAQRAVALDRAGIVTLAVGSALLVGGVVRYAIVGTRARRRRARATAVALPGRVSLGVTLRF